MHAETTEMSAAREAPQRDTVLLSKQAKPVYRWTSLSLALYSSAVTSHQVSSNTTSCSSQAVAPGVSSFRAFPLVWETSTYARAKLTVGETEVIFP